MRRDCLPPPGAPVDERVLAVLVHPEPVVAARDVERAALTNHPRDAPEHQRRLFDPAAGWFRAVERQASLWLSRRFWPHVPGIQRIYDRILRRHLALSEAEVALAGLPRAFHGFRILLVSDLHAGPFVSPEALREGLERLGSVEPDAIVVAGDVTTSQLSEFDSHRPALQALRAPGGVYAVLGNHDHYTGEPERLRGKLEQLGIEVLHNRAVELRRDGASLSLAGIDDLLRGRPDLDAALAGTRDPVILVSHNPDVLFAAARRGVGLVLSGHTHGGQVRLRGLPVLVRQSCYRLDEGRYRAAGTELIVSRGLGAVGLPLRHGCSPEGVLVTLVGR